MDELQQWWEVASIAQFCSLFHLSFNLLEFDIEELEQALVMDGTPEGCSFLQELIIRLLRGCCHRKGVTVENWETFLYKVLEKKWVKEEGRLHPFSGGNKFSQLSLRSKVEIIHSLCLYRLDSNDVVEIMKGLNADSLRVQSLGRDSQGNVYWYFYGTRLYKEEPAELKKCKDWNEEWNEEQKRNEHVGKKRRGRPRKRKHVRSDGESEECEDYDSQRNRDINQTVKSHWSVVCTTISEWHEFAGGFQNSKLLCEKQLYRIIINDFLPLLYDVFEQKEKKIKKQISEYAPRRTSTRLEVKKLQKEEEERLTALVVAEEFGRYQENKSFVEDRMQKQERLGKERTQRLEGRQRVLEENIQVVALEREKVQDNDGLLEVSLPVVPSSNQLLYNDGNIKNEELFSKLRCALSTVKLHKDAWPFIHPVNETYAPGYYEIIKEPIDLSSIDNKIQCKVYKSVHEVDQDFKKMVKNSELYNGEKSEYSYMAHIIWRTFRKSVMKDQLESFCEARNEFNVSEKIISMHPERKQNAIKQSIMTSAKIEDNSHELSEKLKRKKKRKRPPGMKAIEALAEAAEQALKNATTSNVKEPLATGGKDVASPPKLNAFPDLKIVTIQSHPASFLTKYFSSSSSSKDAKKLSSTSLCDTSLIAKNGQGTEMNIEVSYQDKVSTKSINTTNIVTSKQYSNSKSNDDSCFSNCISSTEMETEASETEDGNKSSDDIPFYSEQSNLFSLQNSGGSKEHLQESSDSEISSHSTFIKDLLGETGQSLPVDSNLLSISTAVNSSDELSKVSELVKTVRENQHSQFSETVILKETETKNISTVEFPSSKFDIHSLNDGDLQRLSQSVPPMNVSVADQNKQQIVRQHNSGADLTNSKICTLPSTVDASVIGIRPSNVGKEKQPELNNSVLGRNARSSPISELTFSLPDSDILQAAEKSLNDVLLGLSPDVLESPSDPNKVKQTYPYFIIPGHSSNVSTSQMSSMPSDYDLINDQHLSSTKTLFEVKNFMSSPMLPASVEPNILLSSLLCQQNLQSNVFDHNNESTANKLKTSHKPSLVQGALPSENLIALNGNIPSMPSQPNLFNSIAEQFLPMPVNTHSVGTGTTLQNHIPFHQITSTRSLLPEQNMSHSSSSYVPSSLPYMVSSPSPMQFSIPVTTSAGQITLVPTQQIVTAPVPIAINFVANNAPRSQLSPHAPRSQQLSPHAPVYSSDETSVKFSKRSDINQGTRVSNTDMATNPGSSVAKKKRPHIPEVQNVFFPVLPSNAVNSKHVVMTQNQNMDSGIPNEFYVATGENISVSSYSNSSKPLEFIPFHTNTQKNKINNLLSECNMHLVNQSVSFSKRTNEHNSKRDSVIISAPAISKSSLVNSMPVVTSCFRDSDNIRTNVSEVYNRVPTKESFPPSHEVPLFTRKMLPENLTLNPETDLGNSNTLITLDHKYPLVDHLEENVQSVVQDPTEYAKNNFNRDLRVHNFNSAHEGSKVHHTFVPALQSSHVSHTDSPTSKTSKFNHMLPLLTQNSRSQEQSVLKTSNLSKKHELQQNSLRPVVNVTSEYNLPQKQNINMLHNYVLPGMKPKQPQVLPHVLSQQDKSVSTLPTFITASHYMMSPQSAKHANIVPSHRLNHSNQDLSQKLILDFTANRTTETNTRIPEVENRILQYYATTPQASMK